VVQPVGVAEVRLGNSKAELMIWLNWYSTRPLADRYDANGDAIPTAGNPGRVTTPPTPGAPWASDAATSGGADR
jgi:hypothetical protein